VPAEQIVGAEHLVAFVHIPKTAGATVITMFASAYSKERVSKVGNYLRNPQKGMRKVRRVRREWDRASDGTGARISAGHTPYCILQEVMPLRTRYVTFLRDPVARVLSHYYRHIHRQQPERAGRIKKRPGARMRAESLEMALVEMRLPQIRNLATRFLCTHQSPDEDLPPAALDEAKANLRRFAFVGIQERFDESAALMQRELGMELVPYLSRHVSSGRPEARETSVEDRELIEEHNRLDMELYAFAVELFERQVAAAGESLAADVEELRSASAAADAEYRARHRRLSEWLDRELAPGTSRPYKAIVESASESGISPRELKVAKGLAGVRREYRDGGISHWTRPAT
jgi:sulfotransferase famil protein